jgi:hypothetical protein
MKNQTRVVALHREDLTFMQLVQFRLVIVAKLWSHNIVERAVEFGES